MFFETDDFASRRRPRLESALSLLLRRLQGDRGPIPPWDDGAPIRAELFSVERLEEHARSLAAAQVVTPGHAKGAPLARRLADNEAVLLAAYRDIADAIGAGEAITPVAEWLIDNFHLVEKQIREIRADLPPGYYRQLPKLAGGPFAGYPRVFGVAWAFVAHTDSLFDPEVLRRYLRAYQVAQPLTIGELWAVATTLRIVLVENLRRIAKRVVDSRAGRRAADVVADRLLGAGGRVVEPAEAVLPPHAQTTVSDSFLMQLVHRLRDQLPTPSSATSTRGRSPATSRCATSSRACASSRTSIGLSCSSASAWSMTSSRPEAPSRTWISRRAISIAMPSRTSPVVVNLPNWK
jgi:cyclic beta-1,2-glucan synthetase